MFSFFFPPLSYVSVFFFLEFVKFVCGLRWMCCGDGVACYVECTDVVKTWQGSDCDNRGYQGRRGWDLTLGTTTRRPGVSPADDCEREEEMAESKCMCSPRSAPPLIDTDKCCLTHPPRVTRARTGLSPCVWGPCVYRAFHLHCSWGCNLLTQRGPGRSVRAGVYLCCKCGVLVWGRMWGLEWKVIGCSYEVVGCGWVGGGGAVVLGGRRKRSLVGHSAGGRVGREIFPCPGWQIRKKRLKKDCEKTKTSQYQKFWKPQAS